MSVNWRQFSALRKRPSLHRDRPSAKDAAFKTCSRCKERLSTAEHFRRDARGFWRSHCIECSKAVNQEWRARHRDELLARRRAAYRAGHSREK